MRNLIFTIIIFISLAGIRTPLAETESRQHKQSSDVPLKENGAAGHRLDLADAGLQPKSFSQATRLTPAMVAIPAGNYEIGKYEVTQAEWRAVMGNNPSKFSHCGDDCPVEKVSWDDAQAYIQKLNAVTGSQYRLPTEAEWEFACYGGIHSDYCGGNAVDALAWTEANSDEQTHPVGQKQANGYGLYDMSGNVMEWTDGCWEGDCAQRVFRGGSWINDPRGARVSTRIRFVKSIRNGSGGLRLVRTIP